MAMTADPTAPCAGHECDNCGICRQGRCCRRDQPGYRVPELGEWDGPIFGELGVLVHEDDRVQCHCCGRWFKNLASHAALAHGLTADEYHHVFGLKAHTALIGTALQQRRKELATPRLRAYQPMHAHFVVDLTREERSQLRRLQGCRLETRRDPANLEKWRRQLQLALPRLRELWQDPQFRERTSRRISEARGGRVEVTCAICGTPFRMKLDIPTRMSPMSLESITSAIEFSPSPRIRVLSLGAPKPLDRGSTMPQSCH